MAKFIVKHLDNSEVVEIHTIEACTSSFMLLVALTKLTPSSEKVTLNINRGHHD